MEEFADANVIFGVAKSPEGISPVEKLLNAFEAHESKEDRSVEFYKKALAHMPNPMTRFVMQLVISDEEKHRAVVHAMVSTLKGSLTWSKPADSLEGTSDPAGVNGKLREATEEFIRLEKEGIREYKFLMKESSSYYHGVFKILLDSMVRDSKKHVELLEFIKGNLTDA
jgi:rubrerythrin